MRLCHWNKKLVQFFCNTPFRSLDRAYEASKDMQLYPTFFTRLKIFLPLAGKSPWARAAFETAVFNKFKYVICYSLLEHRLSLSILETHKRFFFCIGNPSLSIIKQWRSHANSKKQSYQIKDGLSRSTHKLLAPAIPEVRSLPSSSIVFESRNQAGDYNGLSRYELKDNPASFSLPVSRFSLNKLHYIKRMNRKLAWIEATYREFDFCKKASSKQVFPPRIENEEPFNYELTISSRSSVAYEPIGLVPRSVTRTLSRFKAELLSKSSFLVQKDFDLARNQAYVSLQYVGFLSLLLPFRLAMENWLLKPGIKAWWDASQIQLFLNPLHEENSLKHLRQAEILLWLDDVIGNLTDIRLYNSDADVHYETIRLAMIYDESIIQLLVQLATDTISIITLLLSFILGRKRLAVSNSRIRESFYSLNDTMKAFSILLLTDLRVGFHSPHGWEILSESFLGHFGLTPNRYVISCFVSTFPVILDTLFKYWIFRHLNRISPSIVATYHTMSE
uniref:Potassium/proton antiporter CemA n=1 Tax=Vaginularia trichoidea TaxID=474354 RepID=A0A3G5CTR0_9MONI|nr:chloroplast envelope membrane protein [Vaginularia trichoidea]AYW16086.1 chloroplast envelope membrane protein [Vaginularia trichoidea]